MKKPGLNTGISGSGFNLYPAGFQEQFFWLATGQCSIHQANAAILETQVRSSGVCVAFKKSDPDFQAVAHGNLPGRFKQ